MGRILSGVLLVLLWFPVAGHGEDDPQSTGREVINSWSLLPMLSSDKPNRLGCTRDSYEKGCFIDFVVSLRYPLFYDALWQGHKSNMLPFFSFTGRLAQYSGTVRHSSPVVTKQFNPELFFRFYTSDTEGEVLGASDSKQDYYDVGYAHESNGQYVDSLALFDSTAASVGGADFAQDYISRGWDYLGYARHLHFHVLGTNSLDVELRYFLPYGFLQKGSEEYFPWEAPREITRISQVDGIRLQVNRDLNWNWFKGANLFFTTGYRDFMRWNTFRAELGFTPLSNLLGLPIVLWGQSGYNSSVTQYYRNAWSVGIAAEFQTYR